MRFEIVRTFPTGRNRAYEYLRDLSRWSEWMPLKVAEGNSFEFFPLKGVSIDGTVRIVDEHAPESCGFVFEAGGFPPVSMTWTLDHAGPGAFTLHLTVFTEPKDGVARFRESILLMKPVLRSTALKALDRLEHVFLGDIEDLEKTPAAATID